MVRSTRFGLWCTAFVVHSPLSAINGLSRKIIRIASWFATPCMPVALTVCIQATLDEKAVAILSLQSFARGCLQRMRYRQQLREREWLAQRVAEHDRKCQERAAEVMQRSVRCWMALVRRAAQAQRREVQRAEQDRCLAVTQIQAFMRMWKVQRSMQTHLDKMYAPALCSWPFSILTTPHPAIAVSCLCCRRPELYSDQQLSFCSGPGGRPGPAPCMRAPPPPPPPASFET